MLAKVIALACFSAFAGAGSAFAQTDGPAELPAADYPGQSYVDSQGCIFLKAGYGGDATWVARVGPDRKPVCGQTPTNDVAKVSDAAATTQRAVRQKHSKTAVRRAAPVTVGCPVSVPVPRRYATTDGGSVVICTAANGSLTGARSPIYPAGSGVGAALSKARYPGVNIPLPGAATAKPALATPAATSPVVAASGATGAQYVQVGAYAELGNAERASARVQALGLPVSKGKFSKQGKALQVIYAGPFASGADARTALLAVIGSGYSDAFIR